MDQHAVDCRFRQRISKAVYNLRAILQFSLDLAMCWACFGRNSFSPLQDPRNQFLAPKLAPKLPWPRMAAAPIGVVLNELHGYTAGMGVDQLKECCTFLQLTKGGRKADLQLRIKARLEVGSTFAAIFSAIPWTAAVNRA